MNFTYENQGANTYLVYDISKDVIDTMSLGMLKNNKIAGFAPVIYMQSDEKKYVKYCVTAKISMKQFLMGIVNRKRLLTVFSGITNALMTAADYMIDSHAILLDENYIFINVSTGEPEMVCLPILKQYDRPVEYGLFFKQVIFGTEYDCSEKCDYVPAIINFLNSAPVLALENFKKLLAELQNERSASEETSVSHVDKEEQNFEKNPSFLAENSIHFEGHSSNSEEPKWDDATKGTMKSSNDSESHVSFAIPGRETAANGDVKDRAEHVPERITFLYLLQHYNKENAAAYKIQKEEEKKIKDLNKKPQKKTKGNKNKTEARQNIVSGEAFPGGSQVVVPTKGISLGGQASQPEMLPYEKLVQDAHEQSAAVGGNFGETVILGNASSGETMILNVGAKKDDEVPFLLRKKNNDKIFLVKPYFRVGRERDYVDYCVADNGAVGRSHANFIIRNGECYVIDTNSTNHTYVNGKMIPSNQEIHLEDGAKVRLADEEFEFRMR